MNCRTAVLGGHAWRCPDCQHVQVVYNSCRNRHCPGCGGPQRARWLDQLLSWQLPVSYFHLVFTLPHELSRLILANRRRLYNLLFQAASQTLTELTADPRHLGAKTGFVMVLHTWGQQAEHHPHIHCVATGGGLSPDGQRWVSTRSPRYFLDVFALSARFGQLYVEGLRRLYRQGQLQLEGKLQAFTTETEWDRFLASLAEQGWVVYCQPPPQDCTGPEAALKYLARYVVGAVISDSRLLADDGQQVTFWYKDYRHGRQRLPMSLPGGEFVRRFLMHILPPGLVRVRYYGLLAHAGRAANLSRCGELLGGGTGSAQAAETAPAEPSDDSLEEEPVTNAAAAGEPPCCRACGSQRMEYYQELSRTSWRDIYLHSRTCRAFDAQRRRAKSPAEP